MLFDSSNSHLSFIAVGNSYQCFYKHVKQRKPYQDAQCDFDMKANVEKWQDDLFIRLKKQYVQLIIIDPKKIQCPQGRCKVAINGIPLFRDSGHLTDYAPYHLATNYLQKYKNPLLTRT